MYENIKRQIIVVAYMRRWQRTKLLGEVNLEVTSRLTSEIATIDATKS